MTRQFTDHACVGYPFGAVRATGRPLPVAQGVWWMELPLASRLESVSVYLMDDGDAGWTLIDTGSADDASRARLASWLNEPLFSSKPVHRVIVTHYHPDHVGLAGALVGDDSDLWTSHGCWQAAHRLWSDQPPTPHPEHVDFMRRAGVFGMELEAFQRNRPPTYADSVLRPPEPFVALAEGDRLRIANRDWEVRIGHGHAREHVTLWSEDGIVVLGDQVLPTVSPNLSVHFSSPDDDPISPWLESCQHFAKLARPDSLGLPGHGRPFHGIPQRCRQLSENCARVKSRLLERLQRPATAVDCLPAIYRRTLQAYERGLLIGEVVGYLNHLLVTGLIARDLGKSGQYLWRKPRRLQPQQTHFENRRRLPTSSSRA